MRSIAAIATLVAGVLIGSLHRHAHHRPAPPPQTACVAPAVQVATPPVDVEEDNYPENLEPTPWNIANFIRDHPAGKLNTLWQRLKITAAPDNGFDFDAACGRCEVKTLEYDLDNDGGRESVLQISDVFATTNRYLIFRYRNTDAELVGHIDARARYPTADPVVFLSHGHAFLIVQSTFTGGSGLGVWNDTLYQVSNAGVKAIASYLVWETQLGEVGLPGKEFFARPLSCELENGRAILTLSYKVEYFAAYHEPPLFRKEQKVVLRTSLKNGAVVVDAARSEVTPREFATIYNFDSMNADDFLQYNYAQLRAIATGKNSKNKAWLRQFLDTCKSSARTRELYLLLSPLPHSSRNQQ